MSEGKRLENLRFWCTKCDIDLIKKGIALDCPEDGFFYECPSCNYRLVIFKKEVECDHEFRDISNHWFHWITGDVMTTGRCWKCGLQKEIKFSRVKKRFKDIE